MKPLRRTNLSALSGVLLAVSLVSLPTLLAAQDSDEKDIISTDGLVRHGDEDAMWENISAQWNELAPQAITKWRKISKEKLVETGGKRDQLVEAVSSAYDMTTLVAKTEVNAWAMSLNATEE